MVDVEQFVSECFPPGSITRSPIYMEGFRAGVAHIGNGIITQNPYERASLEEEVWDFGWIDAVQKTIRKRKAHNTCITAIPQ